MPDLDGQKIIRIEKCSGRPTIVTLNHVAVIQGQGAISEINGDYAVKSAISEINCDYAMQGAISEINGDSYFNNFQSKIHHCQNGISFHGDYFEKDQVRVLSVIKRDIISQLFTY